MQQREIWIHSVPSFEFKANNTGFDLVGFHHGLEITAHFSIRKGYKVK